MSDKPSERDDLVSRLLARVEEAEARLSELDEVGPYPANRALEAMKRADAAEARCAALTEALRSACSVLDANGYRRIAAQFLSVTED